MNKEEKSKNILIRVYDNEFSSQFTQFKILRSKAGGLVRYLANLHAESVVDGDDDSEEESIAEEYGTCPHGDEECDPSEVSTMCSVCHDEFESTHR